MANGQQTILLATSCRDVDPEEIVKVNQRLSALEHESGK